MITRPRSPHHQKYQKLNLLFVTTEHDNHSEFTRKGLQWCIHIHQCEQLNITNQCILYGILYAQKYFQTNTQTIKKNGV